MMHILIAPNAFKNSLNATEVAKFIQNGLHSTELICTTTCFPIADGGDGTASLIVEKCNGQYIEETVHDPLGRKITSCFGLIDNGKTAVIEMADASGLRLLKNSELNPLAATSIGTGELIKTALDKGANKILIAMGGSATVDAGCGILAALGFIFLDGDGNSLNPVPKDLISVKSIVTSKVDPRVPTCEIVILCDVDNPLLGPNGAAAVFGPQKGADENSITQLNNFLTTLAKIADEKFKRPIADLKYGGTAGGAAAGLYAFLNAKLVNGIDYFLDLTNFDQELERTNLLITGEGSIDLQTLQGKGPFGVAKRAFEKQIPVVGLAGKIPLEPEKELLKYFTMLMAIGNEPADLTEAMQNTGKNLERVARNVGSMLFVIK